MSSHKFSHAVNSNKFALLSDNPQDDEEGYDSDEEIQTIIAEEKSKLPVKEGSIESDGAIAPEQDQQSRQDTNHGSTDATEVEESGMDFLVRWFEAVLDPTIADEELPVIVIEDTERAPGYVDDIRETVLTELGIATISLADIRNNLKSHSLSIQSFVEAMMVTHLRMVENGKWQISWPTDRHGDPLWQAAFTEFGESYWIRLRDMAHHAVETVKWAMTPNQDPAHGTNSVLRKIILIGHAMHNDSGILECLGLDWTEHFQILRTIDTQPLLWSFARTKHVPGLRKLMELLDISVIRRHHGGNDAAYTGHVICAVVLSHVQNQARITVDGEPLSDIGTVVDLHRTANYEESSTEYIGWTQVCHVCGAKTHDKLACTRRCLFCLQRRDHETYHNYLACPFRSEDEIAFQDATDHFSDSTKSDKDEMVIRSIGSSKGFIISEQDKARLGLSETKIRRKTINRHTKLTLELNDIHGRTLGGPKWSNGGRPSPKTPKRAGESGSAYTPTHSTSLDAAPNQFRGIALITEDRRIVADQRSQESSKHTVQDQLDFDQDDHEWPSLGNERKY